VSTSSGSQWHELCQLRTGQLESQASEWDFEVCEVILCLLQLFEAASYFPSNQGDVTVKLHLNFEIVSEDLGKSGEENLPLTCGKKELQ
jgi:hypothetical protein